MNTFRCPRCDNPLSAEQPLPGAKIRCPACGAEATVPAETADANAPPGYALLFEIGRSADAVVHAARAGRPSRVVALKLARAGDSARFAAEMETIGRVKHPHVVEVYEVGTHLGAPFASLEYCADGGLDKKLAVGPMQPKDAAALVGHVASALQAVHDAGLVHRDVRPANVLLAENGAPKLTGFALAKPRDEAGKPANNAVFGAPAYLSPEQAAGRALNATADVYSLGVVLYECLIGRPPFRAATPIDTLTQVMSADPVAPRLLNPAVPAELDAIVLKCLAKDPARRFASAKELSDDLARFASSKPTLTRAAGALTGGGMRGNALAAGLAAALLLTLVGGVLGTTLMAISAGNHLARAQRAELTAGRNAEDNEKARRVADAAAAAAQDKIKEAEANAGTALANEKKAKALIATTTASLDELEPAFVTALLRTIGHAAPRYDAAGRNAVPLDSIEVDTLMQVGSLRSERTRLRLIEGALTDPRAAARRPDWLMRAAVGLDDARRKEAAEIILGDGATRRTPEQALAAARLGVELNLSDMRWAKTSADAVASAIGRTTDAAELHSLAHQLKAIGEKLPAEDRFRLAGRAADSLLLVMSKRTDAPSLLSLALASRAACGALPARLAAENATKVLPLLVAAAGRCKTVDERTAIAAALAATTERLNEIEANKLVANVVTGVSDAGDAHNQALVAVALRPILAKLEAERAAVHAGKTADVLADAMGKATDAATLAALAAGLEAVGDRLDAKTATTSVESVLAAAKTAKPDALLPLARGLRAVTQRLETKQKDRAKLSAIVVDTLTKTKETPVILSLAQTLKALDEIDAADAAKAADALVGTIVKANDADVTTALAQALAAVSGKLDAKDAGKAGATLAEQVAGAKRVSDLEGFVACYKAVAGRTNADDADKAATAIVGAMSDAKPGAVDAQAQALKAACARVDAKKAAGHAGKAADAALALLETEKDSDTLNHVGQVLEAVGTWLDAKEADKAATVLVGSLSRTSNANALTSLTLAIDVLGGRLDAAKAAKNATKAAAAIVTALGEGTQGDALHALAQTLVRVGKRMDAVEAATLAGRAAVNVGATLKTQTDANALYSAGQALTTLGGRLGSAEAATVADALVTALSRTREPYARDSLAQALGAAGGRLNAADWARVTKALVALAARDAAMSAALGAACEQRKPAELATLLADPLCAGASERAVLDALGRGVKRTFGNAWQYRDWAAGASKPDAQDRDR